MNKITLITLLFTSLFSLSSLAESLELEYQGDRYHLEIVKNTRSNQILSITVLPKQEYVLALDMQTPLIRFLAGENGCQKYTTKFNELVEILSTPPMRLTTDRFLSYIRPEAMSESLDLFQGEKKIRYTLLNNNLSSEGLKAKIAEILDIEIEVSDLPVINNELSQLQLSLNYELADDAITRQLTQIPLERWMDRIVNAVRFDGFRRGGVFEFEIDVSDRLDFVCDLMSRKVQITGESQFHIDSIQVGETVADERVVLSFLQDLNLEKNLLGVTEYTELQAGILAGWVYEDKGYINQNFYNQDSYDYSDLQTLLKGLFYRPSGRDLYVMRAASADQVEQLILRNRRFEASDYIRVNVPFRMEAR